MGCSVVWKPASSAMLSAYYLYRLLEEAGLPPGVINMVSGDAVMISERLLAHRELAGVHFTGSTTVFNSMWKTIGASMSNYRNYPRIVGETGGKDFIVAHASADVDQVAVAIVRAGFEYQGQKCSAASRVYVPKAMWPALRDRVVAMIAEIKMGDVRDFRNFMGAVIDRKAFDRITGYIEHARANATIVAGGTSDATDGYFVAPTIVETADPGYKLLQEEIFGPVVTVYPYDDSKWLDTLALVDQTSPYALTGAVFARDRRAVLEARPRAAQRRGQLLHQRQAHRRGRGPAAVWRRARVGHQRQGGLEVQPHALGERADGERDLQRAEGLPLSVHGRGIDRVSRVLSGALRCSRVRQVLRVLWGPRRTWFAPANAAVRTASAGECRAHLDAR